jgi:hypothetical protein
VCSSDLTKNSIPIGFAASSINEDAWEKSVSGSSKSAARELSCVKPSKAAKRIAALRLKKGIGYKNR